LESFEEWHEWGFSESLLQTIVYVLSLVLQPSAVGEEEVDTLVFGKRKLKLFRLFSVDANC
jgi:hypothetical protein